MSLILENRKEVTGPFFTDLYHRLIVRLNETIDRHARRYCGIKGSKGKRISQLELSRRTAIPRTTLRDYLFRAYPLTSEAADRLLYAMGWNILDLLTPTELGHPKVQVRQRPANYKKTLRVSAAKKAVQSC